MRELVLGGEGLIGTELVEQLQAKGHTVTSLDLRTGCDIRYVDITPFQECDRVWFLAWDVGGAKYIGATEYQHQLYKNNCELTLRVLDSLSRTKRPFIFTSSQLAGQPTAYGSTKLDAERWAAELGGKVARLWNTYGWETPDIRSHVITDMVLSGLRSGEVQCRTDGTERRRFVYKSDCVVSMLMLANSALMYADTAGLEWVTLRTVAEEIALQLRVGVRFGSERGSEWMVDPTKMMPGWSPEVPLGEGITLVIADARNYLNGAP